MKAMILAAGEGTRLRPLTYTLPKPMVPIANVPLLVRTINLLCAQGITEIAVNLFHMPDAIRDALGDGARLGVRLHYSDEPILMGTAGGVRRMANWLDETFLVLYGDNLYDADFARLLSIHHAAGSQATIATFETDNPTACGLVVSDAHGRVTRFQEKPPIEEVFTNTANAGVYVLEPSLLARIPADMPCDFGKDIFPSLLGDGLPMHAAPLAGYLQDTGTPDNYRKANWDALAKTAGANGLLIGTNVNLPASAKLTGRNIIGDGCVIGANAELHDTILWGNCIIGDGARVSHSVLAHGATVGAGGLVEDVLVAA